MTRGVVAAGHELTARAGVEMLRKGGNAFDAAVAATFTAFVCESALTGIGGGGFLLAHTESDQTILYDFFVNVPGLGKGSERADLQFFPVDVDFTDTVQVFHVGKGAAAVPGCMAGLAEVHRRHCTMPLTTLLAPAVKYAREGVVLNAQQAYFNKILSPILTVSDEGRKVYAPGGRTLREGERIYKKDLADTMEYLAAEGLERFYEGEIAGRMLETFGRNGLITEEDLKRYRVEVREPLEVSYRGKGIFTNPPPSSGGCLIAFALKLLEGYDVDARGHNSFPGLRLLLEVMKITDAARGEDFDHRVYEDDLAETFLSAERIARYREELAGILHPIGACERIASGNTTHISIVDEAGNAAAVTTSNGEGCGYMIPGTGVMLNNMLGEEDINPHGFHVQDPGVRMSSMMSPTIVMGKSGPEIVLGTGGSNRIRNAILQVILNIIDHRLPVSEAVNAPRVHWDGAVLQVEKGVDDDVLNSLEEIGIPINRWRGKNMYFGGVHTVVMDCEERMLTGAGDVRRGGVCLQSV